jgi:hypothetical protein
LAKNGSSRAAAGAEHAFLARERRDHRDVAGLQRREKIRRNVLVADIVHQHVDAFVDHHAGIRELDDRRHRELAVLPRLIEHGRNELAGRLGDPPALGVEPDLDEVGAPGRDLVDMLACRFGCLVVGTIAGKRRSDTDREECVRHAGRRPSAWP